MPNLSESLQGRDLGHLRIVAGLWGVELDDQDPSAAILKLSRLLLSTSLMANMVSNLTSEAKSALDDLMQNAGRLPWAQYSRNYGEVREMGVAKRDRERPYEHPISAVEVLWYHALVARAFFDTPVGPEEFAYIPDDLLGLIPPPEKKGRLTIGRQASALEYAFTSPVSDHILDHACTYLAALRLGINPPDAFTSQGGEELTSLFMQYLMSAGDLLDQVGIPIPEPVRILLEAKRGEALAQLFWAWKQSTQINELRLLPDLIFEGNWENEPLIGRQAILDFVSNTPSQTWWNLGSFVAAIKQRNPDYQRPAGEYDSWFIRHKTSGEYMRGFEHWDEVDGRLIRYILTGPLHWLGVVDLARQEEGAEIMAFRLSGWSKALLQGVSPKGLPLEEESLVIRSDARLSARRLVPRRVRYQISRFCEWVKETPDEYQYRISTASLSRAGQQGLKVPQLLGLLNRHAKAVPPSLVKALERWEKQGIEARLEKMVVLRVVSEDILQALRKSRASRFLGESLGPTTVAVKPGAVDKVLGALAELGYLGEVRGDVD
jgi:Helicase conserved C-terminal domain